MKRIPHPAAWLALGTLAIVAAACSGIRGEAPIDRDFIDMMVPHHETAVAAAKVIGTSTERSELTQVAEDMIESQQGEIDQMQGWLAVWYPG